jgi:hypothetical protein
LRCVAKIIKMMLKFTKQKIFDIKDRDLLQSTGIWKKRASPHKSIDLPNKEILTKCKNIVWYVPEAHFNNIASETERLTNILSEHTSQSDDN